MRGCTVEIGLLLEPLYSAFL